MGYDMSDLNQILRRCVESRSGCWEYQGARGHKGHGYVTIRQRQVYTHRVVYEAMVCEIPDGLHLDHLCCNPPCVNPSHLDPVTPRINNLRSATSPAAINARKTECDYGHPLSGDNLRVEASGRRICRTCKSATSRESYLRRRAAS